MGGGCCRSVSAWRCSRCGHEAGAESVHACVPCVWWGRWVLMLTYIRTKHSHPPSIQHPAPLHPTCSTQHPSTPASPAMPFPHARPPPHRKRPPARKSTGQPSRHSRTALRCVAPRAAVRGDAVWVRLPDVALGTLELPCAALHLAQTVRGDAVWVRLPHVALGTLELPCAALHLAQRFVETRSGYGFPMVFHAVASAMGELLADWMMLVTQLDHQLRLGALNLQALTFHCQVCTAGCGGVEVALTTAPATLHPAPAGADACDQAASGGGHADRQPAATVAHPPPATAHPAPAGADARAQAAGGGGRADRQPADADVRGPAKPPACPVTAAGRGPPRPRAHRTAAGRGRAAVLWHAGALGVGGRA
eukprot:364435-Chlamydomonas_euryale.AAC.5